MSEKGFEVLDNVPMGIFVLQEDYDVLFWNSCLEDRTGIERYEIIGTNIGVHFPHFKDAVYLNRIKTIFEGGPPVIFSSQLHKHIIPSSMWDGRLRIQHTTVASIQPQGHDNTFALFAIQDVTELTNRIEEHKRMRDKVLDEINVRKRVEDKLNKAYADLKDKNEYLERFHKVTVGRELDMIKLKEEVNMLLKKLGMTKKY